MEHLTDREKDILAYIAKIVSEKGYSPSVRDIKSALSIRSTSTVHTYLQRLEEKGLLTKENGKSRTLRVDPAYQASIGFNAQIPILGRVTAGVPILATENFDGYVDFPTPKESGRTDGLFALRVYGTSMIDAGILSGDKVVVRPQQTANDGQIVVALLGDEATVKRLRRRNGQIWLMPENDSYAPIDGTDAQIIGLVKAVVREY